MSQYHPLNNAELNITFAINRHYPPYCSMFKSVTHPPPYTHVPSLQASHNLHHEPEPPSSSPKTLAHSLSGSTSYEWNSCEKLAEPLVRERILLE